LVGSRILCGNITPKGGGIAQERGMYLICDNGYLRWPTSICPYEGAAKSTLEGYFSTNLESVRKDVECTFGILKKRWKILNHGLLHRDISVCKKNICEVLLST
jgi:hypothetical protein